MRRFSGPSTRAEGRSHPQAAHHKDCNCYPQCPLHHLNIVAEASGARSAARKSCKRVSLDSRPAPPLASTAVVELGPRVHRGVLRRREVAAALLAAPIFLVGVALPALVSWRAPAAAADQISTTREQIAALEATAVAGAQRIHTLTVAYNQASFQASALTHEVAEAQAEVQALQAQTARVSSQLRRQAIYSYTGTYTGVPNLYPSSNGPDLAVRAEYISVASGDIKDSLDRYRTARRQLAGAEVELAGQQHQSAAALIAVSQARQQALSEATTDQARLDSLQGQLTRLVAVQQAQVSAAAAAAQAKPTQGLPVNGGLVAVVRATVGPSTPSAAPASAPVSTLPPTVPPTTLPAVPAIPLPAAPAPGAGDGGAGGVWLQLRECESSDNYQANTGNGYYGAYQFSQQTWTNLGYPGRPDLEPAAMQDAAAQKLQAESGWGQWPACSAALGLS